MGPAKSQFDLAKSQFAKPNLALCREDCVSAMPSPDYDDITNIIELYLSTSGMSTSIASIWR